MGRAPTGIKPVRLRTAIDEFCERSRARQAEGTARQKTNIMKSFGQIVGLDTPVWMIKRSDFEKAYDIIINGYVNPEVTRGRRSRPGRNTKGSRQQLRNCLRTFASFCHDEEYMLESVTMPKNDRFPSTKRVMDERREFFVIPRDEWAMILDFAEEIHPRIRAAAALAFYSGRRVSEIASLRFGDIDWRHLEVKFQIHKKGLPVGDTGGLTPLYPDLHEELERWRRWVTEQHGVPQANWFVVPARYHPKDLRSIGVGGEVWDTPWLWPLNVEKKIYLTSLNEDVRKLFAYFGIGPGEGTGMHTFRRSAAVHIADTYGLEVAQAFLGHDTVVTTQQYTRNREGYKKLRHALMMDEQVAVVRSIFEWGTPPGPYNPETRRPALRLVA